MPKKTTIVTAIPYVNSTPHIGTLLTDLAGDITARYFGMRGDDVFFAAGTDENGLKIKEAAEKAGEDPYKFADRISARFIEIFKTFRIDYDAFVRTTGAAHKRAAQELFKRLKENGYVYQDAYEGWYDVSTETYFKESELVDGKSPDGNEVRWMSEKNYFFKLSAFQDRLLDAYQTGKIKIVPETRLNEVVSFIQQGLRDICISRSNPGWGIPVPDDESQVIYVWFDALINYISATGWPDPGFEEKWPATVQWLGKDILTRFHATLWPAMLMGVGLDVPLTLAAHGWILLGSGEKLSKSKGNLVEPAPLAEELAVRAGCSPELAVDAVRYYLGATMPFENDWVFTYEDFDRRYNSDLANDIGNALNRSLAMAHKFAAGVVPDAPIEDQAHAAVRAAKGAYEGAMSGYRIDEAARAAVDLVRGLNKYIDTRAPWALAKSADPALPSVLRSMLFWLRAAEALLRPLSPVLADAIAKQLGLAPQTSWSAILEDSSMPAGTKLEQPAPIYPRLDLKAKPAETSLPQPPPSVSRDPSPATPEAGRREKTEGGGFGTSGGGSGTSEITIEDFMKVQLKMGRVLEAEPLEGSDKLLKLQVMIGDEKRQIVAGIRKNYTPEDIVGMQVVVVANLKPAKLRGTESQGMLLAAVDTEGGAILLTPEKEAPEGAQVR
ncbi:MAG TPA: methionine--tRNA ligase [Fimbriimonadaceae bacterium]|nr:methionine--tRNA ligase [Fimbriimonadaceae bacterium]